MKRAALALLAFLGVACIAAAIAIPTYLVPKLKVVPLDLDITSVAESVPSDGGAADRFPAVIFDRCSITKQKAATLHAQLRQQRRSVIVDPSDAEQATLQSGQTLEIVRVRNDAGSERDLTMASDDGERGCDDALLNATVDRVSVNRKSSAPNGEVSSLQVEAAGEGGSVEDASVPLEDRRGFQYKFGFNVKKTNYYYYDTTTRQDAVAEFVDEKTIDGVKTYHFRADVPEVDLSDLPAPDGEATLGTILNMPAKWWGIKGKGVKSRDLITMHRYAKAVRNVYVEPTTGTIIFGEEDQEQYFRSPDDSGEAPRAVSEFRMTALQSRFRWDDKTVSQQAARADEYLGQLRMGGIIAPIVLGVVGTVLLLAWAILVWIGRRRTDEPNGSDPGDGGPGGGGPGDGGPSSDGPDGPVLAEDDADLDDFLGTTTMIPAAGGAASAERVAAEPTTAIPVSPAPEPYPPYVPPAQSESAQPGSTQPGPAPYERAQPQIIEPRRDGDGAAGDGFTPYLADPTRPMPDMDRYRREP